ncbi:DMT family transporter [Permianibacter sp. IMCC34836]|uniref:DMT family transporter n=1 Tax=Permianibacter fluminis TaxID=2738515 RepID=UPI001557DD50|nr:DMT family transporter [Permianibacter fluminis]NQD35413.1 DMT family transporter [Permianibacter fluminis]
MTSLTDSDRQRAQRERRRGIIAMLCAIALFSGMDAFLKMLVVHYPPMQVSALRGLTATPFVLLSLLWRQRWSAMWPARLPLHALRAGIGVLMLAAFIYGVHSLSLTDAYSIFFVAPLLITAFSVPLLKEHVEWQRWLAIVIGFIGVLIMLRPSGTGFFSLGALAVLFAAACYAFSAILTRIIGRTDSTAAMMFWFTIFLSLGATSLAAPNWTPINWQHWPWFIGVGLTGALGQYFITEAFRRAPAGVVAPFEYTAIIWGVLLDFLVWQAVPRASMLAGASVVIACGLYLLYREQQLHRAP